MRAPLVLVVSLLALPACGDDEEPPSSVDRPLIAGPFAGNLHLNDETHLALPTPEDGIGASDSARFYWFHPGAAGKAITWTIRAEAVGALGQGSVIHEAPEEVEGRQGMAAFHPSQLNRGGARRNEGGNLEWAPGLYSLTGTLEGEELGRALFEVR